MFLIYREANTTVTNYKVVSYGAALKDRVVSDNEAVVNNCYGIVLKAANISSKIETCAV